MNVCIKPFQCRTKYRTDDTLTDEQKYYHGDSKKTQIFNLVSRISVINFIRHTHSKKFPFYCDCVHNVSSIEHLCLYYNLYIYKRAWWHRVMCCKKCCLSISCKYILKSYFFLLCLFIVIHLVMRCNKNVDILFSAHDAFLESPSSDTLKIERFANQII